LCAKIQIQFSEEKTDYQLSGSCAVMALVKEGTVYTANLGDSRAVLPYFAMLTPLE